ncbi:HAMP domain-containing sensor histidine kinase [Ammoniphilus sp. 3BR4]
MANDQLKNRLFQQISNILELHVSEMRNRSEKFESFFEQHHPWMEPIIKAGLKGIMESIFFNGDQYKTFLYKLQDENRQVGNTFLLQVPDLSPNDVLELNQNLYFHLMRTCIHILEAEKEHTVNKSEIIERLYLTFSTSDHSFLQGYLQLKDKQVFDLHHQKISLMGQMAAGMAHEIRNPLTSIKGFIHLMMEQLNKEYIDKDDLKFYLSVCEEQMESLESVVSSFLTLARNKGSQSPAEFYTLQSVMERLNVLAQFYALEKSVSFSFTLPESEVWLHGSPSIMEQICLNIIRNAMDAVSLGGRGEVHIDAVHNKEQKLIDLVFKDNGPGMSPDVLAKIWSPFFTTKETGTGLGLAISRKLTEDIGGTIRIHSTEGKGTEVTLTLPTAEDVRIY